jgi:RHS repeat-associated protein
LRFSLVNENETQPAYFDDFEITHKANPQKLTVSSWAEYYAFGKVAKASCPANGAYRYGYQGEFAEKDQETDWNSFELRQYDSDIARWLSVDPMRQHHSPYLAMSNNPVNFIDPTGGVDWWKDKDGNLSWHDMPPADLSLTWVGTDGYTFQGGHLPEVTIFDDNLKIPILTQLQILLDQNRPDALVLGIGVTTSKIYETEKAGGFLTSYGFSLVLYGESSAQLYFNQESAWGTKEKFGVSGSVGFARVSENAKADWRNSFAGGSRISEVGVGYAGRGIGLNYANSMDNNSPAGFMGNNNVRIISVTGSLSVDRSGGTGVAGKGGFSYATRIDMPWQK